MNAQVVKGLSVNFLIGYYIHDVLYDNVTMSIHQSDIIKFLHNIISHYICLVSRAMERAGPQGLAIIMPTSGVRTRGAGNGN